ncbi:MAG: hypothetical protein WBO55_12485 [Rhizobiaceae bacterium]
MAGNSFARTRLLARLSSEIARIEDRVPLSESFSTDRPSSGRNARAFDALFGLREVDEQLGEVDRHALHEVRTAATADAAAAFGFAVALASRLAPSAETLFWVSCKQACDEAGNIHAPGLNELGFDSTRLVHVRAHCTQEALWAAGEIAAAGGAGLCLLELRGNPAIASLAATRRLALRAAGAGNTIILLRQAGEEEASAAATRWFIRPAVSRNLPPGNAFFGMSQPAGPRSVREIWQGNPAWSVTLEKNRHGRTGNWIMEWKKDERAFELVDPAIGWPSNHRNGAGNHGAAPDSLPPPATVADRPDRPAALGGRVAALRAS